MARWADDSLDEATALGQLGRNVRALRISQGKTLVQLATKVGVSHSMIGQLERGVTRPSMPTLHAVARALGTTAQELLALSSTEPVSVVRSSEGGWADQTGGLGRALVRGRRALQPMEFDGAPAEFENYYEHAGGEMLYVVTGTIEVEIADREKHLLHSGDTIYYEGGIPHRWRQVGPGPLRVLMVTDNPNYVGP